MKHLTQDIECPSCTTLAGPCATTEPGVATPVYALDNTASMSKQVRVCRALKVLYGHGITWHTIGYHLVYFTPGDMCGCTDCATRLTHTIERTAHT
jgi:hypothetical protein